MTEGGIDRAGVFHRLPHLEDSRLAEIFAREVHRLLVGKRLLSPEWAERILSWRHTGFNVHSRVRARTKTETERIGNYADVPRGASALFHLRGDFPYNLGASLPMEKTLQAIEEMTRLGIVEAYAIGGGIAATYYIEPVLTYDLDIFFIPVKSGLDELSPIDDFARGRGYTEEAEALIIEGFPVPFIPAYNDLVREAVAEATTLTCRGVKAKVVRAEHLAAIALQTGRAKDRERFVRLLDGDANDRAALARILEKHGLVEELKKIQSGSDEK